MCQRTTGYNVILRHRFFTKAVFRLSRFRCQLSLTVYGRRNHQTTSKPENATTTGMWRGLKTRFDDKNCVQTMRSKTVRACVRKWSVYVVQHFWTRTARPIVANCFYVRRGPNTGGHDFQSLLCKTIFYERQPFWTHEPSKQGLISNTAASIYIYIYVVRLGSGPSLAILKVRFWAKLSDSFWT